MYITLLGRQPALGIAELERLYGSQSVKWFSENTALVDNDQFDFERLGGSQKAGIVHGELHGDWPQIQKQIISQYSDIWSSHDGKITLGISAYGFKVPARDVQRIGLEIKSHLRKQNVSVRLIPNAEPALNTAASHHNKLGLSANKVELLVVRSKGGRVIIAESVGAQNITALAARDQARPHTDAFVGMLPPKLARMMINLAVSNKRSELREDTVSERSLQPESVLDGPGTKPTKETALSGTSDNKKQVILDPFCGTGVILQEALLLGFDTVGSDLSEKMVDYSRKNLDWLGQKHHHIGQYSVDQGDAMTHQWLPPIDAIASEAYLGQPFSAPPTPAKLREVRDNCNHIIGAFLDNISRQIAPGTPLCLAVPAWNDGHDHFTHLPLAQGLEKYGFKRVELTNVRSQELLYYRPGQVVARELLLMQRS